MPGYTSEEVQASVDQFLLGTVTTPRTSLGARDVLTARDDIYALLTTTLLLRPDSYFYAIWLAKNRLEALRRKQIADLTFILDPATVSALGRRGRPVASTTELVNAQAALLNLNAGLNSGQGVQTRDLGPEVTRFRSSVDRFIRKEIQPNVVENGVPTETAGEIRERIASTWVGVKARHGEMLVLCESIISAISNLNSVRLPEKAVREVITRLRTRLDELTTSLAADKSLSTHRESMLELLTMRTLLSRVSSFRTPQRVLAPLTGDSVLVTGAGSATPASLLGTISGPYSLAPASTLDFEAGSPVVASGIAITNYSNARVQTRAFTAPPITMPATAALQLRVDGTLYPNDTTFGGVVYASLADLSTDIQAYLTTNVIPATSLVVGSRVVIRSDSSADNSSVEVLAGTSAQVNLVVLLGIERYGVAQPVTAASIIADSTPYPGVRLSAITTDYFVRNGITAGTAINLAKVSGNMVIGGSEMTASLNVENAGVQVGDWLWTSSEVRIITAVRGAQVTVEPEMPALGPVPYRIGADYRDIPAGTRVLAASLGAPLNSGPYRIVSGDIGRVVLDRAFFLNGDTVSVVCQSSFLFAQAPGSTPADGITAWPGSAGATAIGYTPSATQARAQFTELQVAGNVDLLARGVGVGDIVELVTSTPQTTYVTAVGVNTLSVEPTPYFTGNVQYSIRSVRYVAWETMLSTITSFVTDTNFETADFAITRLLSGAAPRVLLGSAGSVAALYDELVDLSGIEDYVVPFERSVDNILKMLVEQGMDRAADLFTTLQVIEFFGMHPDGVSYSTNLIRTAHTVTMKVAPVSRFAKSILGSPEVRLRSRQRS